MEQEIIYTRTGQPHMIYKGSFSPILCRPDRRDADRTNTGIEYREAIVRKETDLINNWPFIISSNSPDWARP